MTPEQADTLRIMLAGLPTPDAPSPSARAGSDAFAEPLVIDFVYAFLVWQASLREASSALNRILGGVVDCNELRVCLAEDIVNLIGPEYPLAEERAMRLRAALNQIYAREHAVTLVGLGDQAKREARAYLSSLEGVPGFVASRMALLHCGAHAFPTDRRVVHVLTTWRVLPEGIADEAAAGSIEHALRIGEVLPWYTALEHWLDGRPDLRPPPPKPEVKRVGKSRRAASEGSPRRRRAKANEPSKGGDA